MIISKPEIPGAATHSLLHFLSVIELIIDLVAVFCLKYLKNVISFDQISFQEAKLPNRKVLNVRS